MKLLKIAAAAALAAAVLPTSPLHTAAADADDMPVLKADVNGDYIINSQDMVLLNKFLLGSGELTAEQAERADFDSDGVIDTFDLLGMRRSFVRNATTVPQGTWIGESSEGMRFCWFNKGREGSFADLAENTSTAFSMSKWGDGIDFTLSSGDELSSTIAWLDDEHFYLKWSDSPPELFTHKSDVPYYNGPSVAGEYVSDAGNTYKLSGYTGTCGGEDFLVLPMGTQAQFIYSDGTAKTGDFSRTDKYHFTLRWEDGTTESFTRREITVKDGITYVNGILIANKTYALPSTYAPGGLTAEFNTAFAKMQAAAKADGRKLEICSGYRSYSYQSQLYNGYVARDGKAAADTYSARPGHSEHQTGLAADINYASDYFNTTPEAKWLAENCYKYGFIIRYPKGKEDITGYKYEGWHVRYLGEELAKLVYDSGLTLEEYLCIDSKYSY